MKRQNAQNISDLLGVFLQENGLETPYLQYRLISDWPEAVGADIAARAHAIEIRGGVLWVEVTSPALVTELQMRRNALVTMLNGRVGASIITDIRFIPK